MVRWIFDETAHGLEAATARLGIIRVERDAISRFVREGGAIGGAQVIDLMAALQASLGKKPAAAAGAKTAMAKPKESKAVPISEAKVRKGVKRATPAEADAATEPVPASARARK